MPPRRGRRRLVALASDLGAAYAAQMKAVLARSVDPGRILDLTHDLPAHGIAEAAFVVRAIGTHLPSGTILVVVVDPGVGGTRAPISIACREGSVLVGPDNGVLYPLATALGGGRAYRIDPRRWGPTERVGTTFDGRDVFAPAAALLFRGRPPWRLGPPIDPVPYAPPEAARSRGGADGEVVHVDRFGNLVTNIPTDWVPAGVRGPRAAVGRRRLRRWPWATSYESLGPGRSGLLGSSFGTVEVAVAGGRAADLLGAKVGTRVVLRWTPPRSRATRTVNSARPRRR